MGAHLGAHRRPRIHYCAAAEHIGLQDLAPCYASQPGIAARARAYLIAFAHSAPSTPLPSRCRSRSAPPSRTRRSTRWQFRSERHHRLNRPSVARRCETAAAVPGRQPQRQARLADSRRAREPMPPLPPALTIAPMPQAEIEAPRQRATKSTKAASTVYGIRIRRHSRRAEASIFAGPLPEPKRAAPSAAAAAPRQTQLRPKKARGFSSASIRSANKSKSNHGPPAKHRR